MKKLMLIFCSVFSFFCCAQKRQFESCSPPEFEKLLKGDSTVQLVDVRRPDEYAAGHIAHAVLINVQDSGFVAAAVALLDRSKPVAVYCRSGKRSKEAAVLLSKEGFKVHELSSGYNGWVDYQASKKQYK
jgi:rhodanese-related sulfurtransferase